MNNIVLVSLLNKGDTVGKSRSFNHVSSLQNWCPFFNIGNTKELATSSKQKFSDRRQPLLIEGHTLEMVMPGSDHKIFVC